MLILSVIHCSVGFTNSGNDSSFLRSLQRRFHLRRCRQRPTASQQADSLIYEGGIGADSLFVTGRVNSSTIGGDNALLLQAVMTYFHRRSASVPSSMPIW